MSDNERPQFTIIGMPENFTIPEEPEISPDEEKRRAALKRMGLSERDINQAIKEMKNIDPEKLMKNIQGIDKTELLKQLMKETGMPMSEAQSLLDELENMTKSLFGGKSPFQFPGMDQDNSLDDNTEEEDDMFDDEDEEETDDDLDDDGEELEEDEESNNSSNSNTQSIDDLFDDIFKAPITPSPKQTEASTKKQKPKKKVNTNGAYSVITNPASFGIIPCQRDEKIYEDFQTLYGEGPKFPINIFSSTIQGYNLNKAFGELKEIKYLDNTDKFILFEGIPTDPKNSTMALAVLKNDDMFEIVVPEYGNTFDSESGTLFNEDEDSQLYIKDEKTNKLSLEKPLDITKLKAGLDLLLYEIKKPILSVSDFGKVIAVPTTFEYPSNRIKIGRIKAFDNAVARLFRRDFELDQEVSMYDFYARFKYQYPERNLEEIGSYLYKIDFNTNEKIQTYELQANSSGEIYIDLDLGIFPENIRKWLQE